MDAVMYVLSVLLHMGSAIAMLIFGAWLYARRSRIGPTGDSLMAALGITAFWALAVATMGAMNPGTRMFLSLSHLAWLWALYRLFANDGRHTSVSPIRPVVMALGFVEIMQLVLIVAVARFSSEPGALNMIFEIVVTFRLLSMVGALVLVHNLYAGASNASRQTLRWPAAALATMWLYDLNYYTIAYLSGSFPEILLQLRGLVLLVMVVLFAIGMGQSGGELRLRASRSVAFQSISLLLIGGYLIGMVVVAQALAYIGSDFAGLIQMGFLALASVAALLLLPSPRVRSWIRVVLAKHLFQHRYDYREEWLRFTKTIARGGEQVMPLHQRVVQAMADITDSPGGLLLMEDEDGAITLNSRWQWPEADVPCEALTQEAARFFEKDGFILDLDDLREGMDRRGEARHVPAWLLEDRRAWAMVPLLHFQRLVGMVVLARPPIARKLDWEDFDLLRVVGQQLASYLAEHEGQEALSEAHRFDEFNRRIAFVMHDIKNLASQLSLLSSNAERHADNPEFRADMLVTLRNSSDKLNNLLSRLSRYGAGGNEQQTRLNVGDCLQRVARRYEGQHPVIVMAEEGCDVLANADALEQALVHLVQNAIDASDQDSPVMLNARVDGIYCHIDVLDSGSGMSPEFIRSRLFKPFHSSKPGGFGIGAFEARELIRSMQGRLEVDSREGIGTRFLIRLPIAEAAGYLDRSGGNAPPDSNAGRTEVA